ncbi:recombinase family protein [bacterium]|nr:recombinase family protein [bacterium]
MTIPKNYPKRFQRNSSFKLTNEPTVEPRLVFVEYTRKSSDSDERQIQSIPDQKAWAARAEAEQGLRVIRRLEESQSAKEPGRPVFGAAIALIESGSANALLVWDPSRLSRNPVDQAKIITLMDAGLLQCVVTASMTYYNRSTDKFMLGFLMTEGKRYSDSLGEVVRRGMQSRVDKGIFPGPARLGYANNPKTKIAEPDPLVFPLIQVAFAKYLTGTCSCRDIALWLYREGVSTRQRKPFSPQHIMDMLSDHFYYGAFIYKGVLYEGIQEPAVSKADWDKAQQVMKERGRKQAQYKEAFVYSSLLRCAECGCAVTAERHTKRMKSGKVHSWVYYRCTKKNPRMACSQPYLREESLTAQLYELMLQVALPDDWAMPMLEQIDKWSAEEKEQTIGRIAEIELEMEKISAKLSRLNDLLVDGEMNRADYAARKKPLVEQRVALEARKAEIAHKGADWWLEPLRKQVNAVWLRNLQTAEGDPMKLRELLSQACSNQSVESRKVLSDWNSHYAPLARRGEFKDWWALLDSNQ